MRSTRRGLLVALAVVVAGSFGLTGVTATAERDDRAPMVWGNVSTGGGGGYVPASSSTRSSRTWPTRGPTSAARTAGTSAPARWVQLLNWVSADNWNLSGVESIATDPVNPNRLVLAVGRTPTSSRRRTAPSCGPPTRDKRSSDHAAVQERQQHARPLDGRAPGHRPQPGQRHLLRRPQRQRPVAEHRLRRHVGPGDQLHRAGHVRREGRRQLCRRSRRRRVGGVRSHERVARTRQPEHLRRHREQGRQHLPQHRRRRHVGGRAGPAERLLPQHGVWSNGRLLISYSNGAGPFDGSSGDVWQRARPPAPGR